MRPIKPKKEKFFNYLGNFEQTEYDLAIHYWKQDCDKWDSGDRSADYSSFGSGCFGIFVILFLPFLASPFLSSTSSNQVSKESITLKASCGSSPSDSSTWFAVVGNENAYSTIKEKYCADSFIRPDGSLQVASFTSEAEAQKFADFLKQSSGYDFWVGN